MKVGEWDNPVLFGKKPYFGKGRIRAFTGLCFLHFLAPEGIIPENGGIMHPILSIFTSENQRSHLATFWRQNSSQNGFWFVEAGRP
jgi:hypothetical protein